MFQPILNSGKRALLTGVALTVLAACTGDTVVNLPKFADRMNGNDSSSPGGTVQATTARPTPDSRGVITYPTYQVMVASDGDTVASMAQRVGLTPDELARHNGLRPDSRLRAGELLALPRNVGGELVGGAGAWNTEIVSSAIDRSTGAPATTTSPFGTASPGGVEPQRHRAVAGETAASIARDYNVSVTALASWNGLGPDLAIRPGQELLIPTAAVSTVQPLAPVVSVPGEVTEIAPPDSATDPLPEPVEVATVPEAPDLNQTAVATRLSPPVNGSIVLPYSPAAGPNKNEGVDFGAPAGTPVKAAADGTVALVSDALGGLGTIVLIRHADGLITVYGRIAGVTVAKGQTVSRGQTIGVVASNDPSTLHFEVRKGTESVDPAPYL